VPGRAVRLVLQDIKIFEKSKCNLFTAGCVLINKEIKEKQKMIYIKTRTLEIISFMMVLASIVVLSVLSYSFYLKW
jgi:hypothetical protein